MVDVNILFNIFDRFGSPVILSLLLSPVKMRLCTIAQKRKFQLAGFSLQPHQLFIEIRVHVLAGRDQPARKLGCDVYFLAIPAGKCPADKGLALPGMVGPGRIHIIHAVVDGVTEHLCCMGLVDFSVICYRQAHAAEAEDGEVRLVQFPVEHFWSLLRFGYGWDGG